MEMKDSGTLEKEVFGEHYNTPGQGFWEFVGVFHGQGYES
jgi:hypothetical protein